MEAESVKCSVWATSLGGLVPEAYGPRVFTRYYRDILSYTSKRCASGLELSRSEDRAPEPSSQPNIYVLFNRLGPPVNLYRRHNTWYSFVFMPMVVR